MVGVGMTNKTGEALASPEILENTARRLRARGFDAHVAPNVGTAKVLAAGFIPSGAEVLTESSETLRTSGLASMIDDSGRFNALRPKLALLDSAAKADAYRWLTSTPDVVIGSVEALTRSGQLVCTSVSGGQLSAYVYGARQVILIVGADKIVSDLPAAFRHAEKLHGGDGVVPKMLVMNVEPERLRTSVILVAERLG
jgi:hypothetical protein